MAAPRSRSASAKAPGADASKRPTGIEALDTLLNGGFPAGATVLLAGSSGTGKTILATHWLFAGYDLYGEPGIYISMTEPVVKAIRNASNMSFFKQELINPLQVHFTDLRAVMKGMDLDNQDFTKDDIARLVDMIRNMAKQSGAKRVVLDSVTAMAYRLRDKDLIRDFIFQLGTMLGQIDANVILTSEVTGEGYSVFGVEEFISDGILKLAYLPGAEERIRQLEVVKMRGSAFNAHPSVYRITTDGIRMFPYAHRELVGRISDKRLSTGIAGFDRMAMGGFFEGSATLMTGASGTGKTVTTLHLVADALKKGKRCLYVSLEESRDQLYKNAASFYVDFAAYEKKGQLRTVAMYPEQRYLDEHVLEIQRAVAEGGIELAVIDSLTALGNTFNEALVRDFTARMVTYFKNKLVTSVFTHASESLLGATGITEARLSSLFDNIVMLRFVEVSSALRRGIIIIKMRGSDHDEALREFVFTPQGIRISTDFSGYEGVMHGEARKISETIEEKLRALLVGVFGARGEVILAQEKAKGLSFDGTRALLKELGDQGILSVRRKKEFLNDLEKAAGRS
ncbi:MAG TPA: circadian clock protein KaiC [Candidatus Eisenbacteria bacterium]|nr:circadian clock protein KaiC [Candidatus Eisenbacteria bacterium]